MPTPLEIYDKLKPKLGEEEACLATRSDLAALKADLERRMEVLKADLVKWTLASRIGNIVVIPGIVFATVRL